MKYILLFIIVILFIGCPKINGIPSAKKWADDTIGANIDIIYKMNKRNINNSGDKFVYWWRKNNINKDYYLPNGNLMHVHPIRKGCLIHWEVDKNTNKIIGYKFEGDKCY